MFAEVVMQSKLILLWLVIESFGSALAERPGSPFTGNWEGRVNGLPAVELALTQLDGKVSGEITFPFHQRGADGKWEVKRRDSGPMLVSNLQGRTLTFEVTHHKCHGCSELGPNVKFRMNLTGPDEARLFMIESQPTDSPGLRLIRRK